MDGHLYHDLILFSSSIQLQSETSVHTSDAGFVAEVRQRELKNRGGATR